MTPPRVFRCFDRRFFAQVVLGAVATVALAWLAKRFPRGSAERITVAVATSVVFGWVVAITVGVIRRLDELEQRIHLIAIAVSFAVTGMLLSAVSWIEHAGGPRLIPDDVWWPVMVLVWIAAVFVTTRRYR